MIVAGSMMFGRPNRFAVPRGAIWAAAAASAVLSALHRVDAWLLRRRRSDEPQTAEEVQAWAQRIEASEPSLAADLRGAAARTLPSQWPA